MKHTKTNSEKVDDLICVLENNYKLSTQINELKGNIISITIKGDKCSVAYKNRGVDEFKNPYFMQYFQHNQWTYEIENQIFFIIIKTNQIVWRNDFNNILIRYFVKIKNNNNYFFNGKISKLQDKKDLDVRLVEEIKKILNSKGNVMVKNNHYSISISEESLDISYRYNLQKNL